MGIPENPYVEQAEFGAMGIDEAALAIFAGFAVYSIVMVALSLVMYIVYAIGMQRIARNEGRSKGWFVWVPYLNLLALPMSVEQDVHRSIRGKFTRLNVGLFVMSLLTAFAAGFYVEIAPVAVVIGLYCGCVAMVITLMLLQVYAFYVLTDRYSNKVALNMVVAIVSSGFSVPFQVLRFSGRESLYEE